MTDDKLECRGLMLYSHAGAQLPASFFRLCMFERFESFAVDHLGRHDREGDSWSADDRDNTFGRESVRGSLMT